MLQRILQLLVMHRNARYYGITFNRRANFKMPNEILYNKNMIPIYYPNELGSRNDFIGIFITDEYWLRKIRKNANKIIDIGANVGFFSIAARHNFPYAEIHAYEPNTNLGKFLDNNKENFNFKIFYEAVGGHEGAISIDLLGDSNQTRVKETTNGSLKKISLDNAIERIGGSIDILKIDCEGSEWEMFDEAKKWSEISRLTMEYHLFNGQSHNQVSSELRRIGFEVIKQNFDPSSDFGMIYGINLKKTNEWM